MSDPTLRVFLYQALAAEYGIIIKSKAAPKLVKTLTAMRDSDEKLAILTILRAPPGVWIYKADQIKDIDDDED